MNVHREPALVLDTIDSIRHHMTKDILVVVDGVAAPIFNGVALPTHRVQGFHHGHPSAPYRNVALGARSVLQQYPDADWYCYIEPDCLVGNDHYMNVLQNVGPDVWAVGNDHRVGKIRIALIDKIIGTPIEQSHYLLGCCVFYKGEFFRRLRDLDFFDKFLAVTNGFDKGFYPKFHEYDISEHLYTSIAVALGGRVVGVAVYAEQVGEWGGDDRTFRLRFRPELDDEYHDGISLMHPIKRVDHPARVYHKLRRNRGR